jgi:predicted RNA-binding protein with PIN domain
VVSDKNWLLIDGYNLLHASGVLGTGGRTALEGAREAMLDWLGSVLTETQRRRTTVVFDARGAPPGLPREGEKHGMRIRFAPRGGEADDVLEDLVREHTTPRSLVVVSSDHRLHRVARRRRATAIDSDRWVAGLRGRSASRKQRERPAVEGPEDLSAEELQAWLDEFAEE